MMKIDVNKSGRIFDFLVSSGMLVLSYDPAAVAAAAAAAAASGGGGGGGTKPVDHSVIQFRELPDRPSLSEVKLNGGP